MGAVRTKFKPGNIIFSEGSLGHNFYFIEKGKVEVSKMVTGKKIVLATLGPNETFGEYALLNRKESRRSATAKVLEDSEIVVLDEAALESSLANAPKFMVSIVQNLISKLKQLEDRCFKAETRWDKVNLTYLVESIEKSGNDLANKFPIYLKKYSQDDRKAIIAVLGKMIEKANAQYGISSE